MVIRQIQINDLETVIEIEKEAFVTPWKESDFLYEIQVNPFSKIYVLEIENIIIGYIGYWLLGDQSQITTIAIRTQYQGNGYAKALIQKCIDDTHTKDYPIITLEVRVSNEKAICLYKQFGFVIATIRKNYYTDTNEDAYLMIKNIKEG